MASPNRAARPPATAPATTTAHSAAAGAGASAAGYVRARPRRGVAFAAAVSYCEEAADAQLGNALFEYNRAASGFKTHGLKKRPRLSRPSLSPGAIAALQAVEDAERLAGSPDDDNDDDDDEEEKEERGGCHEDACARCGLGGRLLCCAQCPKVMHLACLLPPLLSAPKGPWVCPSCAFAHVGEPNVPGILAAASAAASAAGGGAAAAAHADDDDDDDDDDDFEDDFDKPKKAPSKKMGKKTAARQAVRPRYDGNDDAAEDCESEPPRESRHGWPMIPVEHIPVGRFEVANWKGDGLFYEESTGCVYFAGSSSMQTQTSGDEFYFVADTSGRLMIGTKHFHWLTVVGDGLDLRAMPGGFDEDCFFHAYNAKQDNNNTDHADDVIDDDGDYEDGGGGGGGGDVSMLSIALRHASSGLWLTCSRHQRADSSRSVSLNRNAANSFVAATALVFTLMQPPSFN